MKFKTDISKTVFYLGRSIFFNADKEYEVNDSGLASALKEAEMRKKK